MLDSPEPLVVADMHSFTVGGTKSVRFPRSGYGFPQEMPKRFISGWSDTPACSIHANVEPMGITRFIPIAWNHHTQPRHRKHERSYHRSLPARAFRCVMLSCRECLCGSVRQVGDDLLRWLK